MTGLDEDYDAIVEITGLRNLSLPDSMAETSRESHSPSPFGSALSSTRRTPTFENFSASPSRCSWPQDSLRADEEEKHSSNYEF